MPPSQPRSEEIVPLPSSWARASVEPMAGDASTRRFYRLKDGTRGTTAILMVYGEDQPAPAVETFRQTAAYFRAAGLRVPVIYEAHPDAGYLVVEDLGDTTLETRLEREPLAAVSLYDKSAALLKRLWQTPPDRGPVAARRLDGPLFRRELETTLAWLLGAELGIELSQDAWESVSGEIERLTRLLEAQPLVVCHRDFHSRNILCTSTGLALVDFQDARLGPYTYDLASLAHDAYVEVPGAIRERMRAMLRRQARGRNPDRDLDRAVLQRSFKAAGTFAYQHAARGRSIYSRALPAALRHAAGAAERLGGFPALGRLIERCRRHLS